MIAQVVFNLAIDKYFEYKIPSGFREKIRPLQRVMVEFNNKQRWGIVLKIKEETQRKELKPILDILDNTPILDNFDLEFAKRISKNYFISLGEALELFLPPYLRRIKKNEKELKIFNLNYQEFKVRLILKEDKELFEELESEICRIINQGKQVLIIVPLYTDVLKWLTMLEKFNANIATLSSKQTPKTFFKEWLKIKEQKAQIILGTRVAIFCPARNLALIVVNKEYSDSFKQQEKPFYNLRDLALMRAELEKKEIIFGSNLPSLEIFMYFKERGNFLDNLDKDKKVYFIEKKKYQTVKKTILNPFIDTLIRNYLENNQKVTILFNKAGYARTVYCKVCGNVLKCERCGVALVYHSESKELVCHFCAKRYPFKEECPKCGSSFVRFSGWGIEKLEKEFSRIFLDKVVVRLDKEERILPEDWNIILCTQIIYNYDLKTDLFIILDIDSFLNFQDFRNAEKVMRLLYESLKKTKRELVVFTSTPDFYPFKYLRDFDLKGFYEKEEALRKEAGLPPFGHVCLIRFRAKKPSTSLKKAEQFYDFLKKRYPFIEIFTPSFSFPFKLREKFRWQILLKYSNIKILRKAVTEVLNKIKPSAVKISIEIDLE